MLSVTYQTYMLSVIMLNVVLLSVVAPIRTISHMLQIRQRVGTIKRTHVR
jgi:hypothetical protein